VSAQEPRNFSTAEAEALLPEIDRMLATAQELLARFDQMPRPRSGSSQANGQVRRDGEVRAAQPPSELEAIQTQLQRILDQIQAQGVIVRDIRSGLIDFPAVRDGRTIYLCWKRGEPLRIEWWHPTTTGIAGRQRL
jgi:hypothetical protein